MGSLVRTGVRTLRCNKGRFISQLVELRGDGGDVDHVEILPVLNCQIHLNTSLLFFSNHCQKNWVNALSLHVKQTEPES